MTPDPSAVSPVPVMFRFAGELLFSEYLEFQRKLVVRRRMVLRGLVGIYGVWMIGYGLLGHSPGENRQFTLAIGGFALFYATAVSAWLFRLQVKWRWKQSPRKPMDITISHEGIDLPDDRGNAAHWNWDNFIRRDETASLFLIFMSPRMALCLPKRLLFPENPAAFRQLLAETFPAGSDEEKDA